MEIDNRLPADNINAKPDALHRETFWMLAGGAIAVGVLLISTWLVGTYLAPLIPFEFEVALAKTSFGQETLVLDRHPDPKVDAARVAAEQDLQRLADALREPLAMPANMPIAVHLSNRPIDNAFATFGGNIVLFKGLLSKLQTEEAVAALLAHEMAHVKHRHVARSLGRGLAFTFAASFISDDVANYLGQLVMSAENMAMAGFSREQERVCDAQSLAASQKRYGHVEGVMGLMKQLEQLSQDSEKGGVLLRSHPFTRERIEHTQQWQLAHPEHAPKSRTTLSQSLGIYLFSTPTTAPAIQ